VFNIVWEKHLSHQVDLMERFYNLLLDAPTTATPAVLVIKHCMHQLLRVGQTIWLF